MSKEKANDNKLKRIIYEYLPYVILAILVLLFKKFVFSPIKVNGSSMEKTLYDGDIMILNIIGYRFNDIKRYDIVVVKVENRTSHEFIIKRVIGLPGEEIEYKNNVLYVNGKEMKNNYATGNTEDFKIVVPEGKYFVLGDNRENSIDSRVFGPFEEDNILGKTHLILFPFDRAGKKEW